MPDHSEIAREFVESFNERELDRFVATLHPEVEIHGGRGLREGREQAREWATRAPGGVQQRIILEGLDERGDQVLATIVREWWWEHGEDDHEFAHHDQMAWLFCFADGLIREWRPFDDREQAKARFAEVTGAGP